ncbi:class I SAM-dependent methyltransferase [Streptomyces sp. TRM 70361]|uniref:class I SAM-dependent methyltransferase n=1 Tax=Streptomyces sp. TRM 70361 TaxID=3116553 RepID=UPI002E7C0CCB|nr:class I SAM-dependent methyltransferase [Streptomyces sp. TRM 70361]MEE1941381.1 class I SAM-dependent methyltransferase [Streptomyces sp. TRM 70361]
MARLPGTVGYGEDAEALACLYEGVTFEDVHGDLLPWLPPAPGRVVDIGAGSGRDAAALAARGYAVVAVEPTSELRRIGQRLHAGAAIEWVDAALPALTGLCGPFDLVLLSAVWMHLDSRERVEGMRRVAELTAPGVCVAMSLRHGPPPAGRRMFDVSAAETVALAERFGLTVVHRGEGPDRLGRAEVRWSTLVFRTQHRAVVGRK